MMYQFDVETSRQAGLVITLKRKAIDISTLKSKYTLAILLKETLTLYYMKV